VTPTCPRCGEPLPNRRIPALSRWDNRTYICNNCGMAEALLQYEAMEKGKNPYDNIHPTGGSIVWSIFKGRVRK